MTTTEKLLNLLLESCDLGAEDVVTVAEDAERGLLHGRINPFVETTQVKKWYRHGERS